MNPDKNFWNERYITQQTGWDLSVASPPLKAYIDQLEDKSIDILIPGCGNAYEAEYLLEQGFKSITLIDLSTHLVDNLRKKFKNHPEIRVIEGDFFDHEDRYDLILEQTFFCAIDPHLRGSYCQHCHSLLKPDGKVAGLLFNRNFEQSGPPHGGSLQEYISLFNSRFEIKKLEPAYNSIGPRKDSELFFILKKSKLI